MNWLVIYAGEGDGAAQFCLFNNRQSAEQHVLKGLHAECGMNTPDALVDEYNDAVSEFASDETAHFLGCSFTLVQLEYGKNTLVEF